MNIDTIYRLLPDQLAFISIFLRSGIMNRLFFGNEMIEKNQNGTKL